MWKKRIRCMLAVILVCLLCPISVFAEITDSEDLIGIEAPHALLMEVSTGKVLYEKDAHTAMPPASVTKIMTMLLIFEALEEERITSEDTVTVSEYAASMGGSQVYLETGEKQTVDTMLKCIAIASANDACVAMAEYVSGSETAFANQMNERAKELGMKDTHFVNCNGLDAEGHVTSAYDIALMSRELLLNHPQIHEYCTVWMDTIIHTTAKGSQEFGLTNTNKLVRQYEYCTGLKTGSTSGAGFCISASAKKENMELVAVIMKGETSKSRFADAVTLLNYGYANYRLYHDSDAEREHLEPVAVKGGVKREIQPFYEKEYTCILEKGENASEMESRLNIPEEIQAPVEEGQQIGTMEYYYGNEKRGEIRILAGESIAEAGYMDYVKRVWLAWMM